jgi:N utilization substance protein A
VLVTDDQLSLAIGRRGQNVRLASKLVGQDIEIMTHDELADSLERAERWFRQLPHVGEEQIQSMIEEGFLSYNELTFIDAAELSEFTGLAAEQAEEVLAYAEEYADVMEQSAEQERADADEAARVAAQEAQAQAAAEAETPAELAETITESTEAIAEQEAEPETGEEPPPVEELVEVTQESEEKAGAAV